MGTSVASEPLNFFIIVIDDIWPTYGFLLAHLEMVALTPSQIYLMRYLIDITTHRIGHFKDKKLCFGSTVVSKIYLVGGGGGGLLAKN